LAIATACGRELCDLQWSQVELATGARTDPFLLKFGSPDECLNEAAKRAKAYADAGADGIFVA